MKWLILISTLLLTACSNLPLNIQNPPEANLQLKQVQQNSTRYQHMPVRWGGTIIDVENKSESSNIQILFHPLNYFGRPKLDQPSYGRFVASSNMFLDPAIYEKGKEITIAGKIHGSLQKQIGEKSLTLPVVAIDNHHIWPKSNRNSNRYTDHYLYPYSSFGYRYPYYPYRFYRGGYGYYNCY